MDTPVLIRKVRDGDRHLSFAAAVLGAATTERPGAPRWTELTVYRLPRFSGEDPATGGYVVAKIGRSVLAHRFTCPKADPRRMPTLAAADADELAVHRLPCLTCQPIQDGRDVVLERTRYMVLQARDPEDLARTLLRGRPGDPVPTSITGIIAETVRQIRLADPDFDRWAAENLDTTGLWPPSERRRAHA